MPHNDINKSVFYELKGKSLAAALDLHGKMHDELLPALKTLQAAKKGSLLSMLRATMQVMPILLGQKDVSYAQAAKAFSNEDFLPLVHAFQAKYKDLYDATGQNSRAVKISYTEGSYPRAYAHTPQLYFHPVYKNNRVVLIAPVDYKDRTFQPEDAVPLSDGEAKVLCEGLWLGGHSDPVPVIHRRTPYGVQTPPDFDLQTSFYTQYPTPFDPRKTDELVRVFNNIMKGLIKDGAVPGMDNPEDVSLSCSIVDHENGRPKILVALFNKNDHTPLTLKDNAYFTIRPDLGAYEVVPRAHKPLQRTDTAGGGALQSFIDAVPNLSAEEIWQTCDLADEESFIKPPPPPRELLHTAPEAPWPFPKSTLAP